MMTFEMLEKSFGIAIDDNDNEMVAYFCGTVISNAHQHLLCGSLDDAHDVLRFAHEKLCPKAKGVADASVRETLAYFQGSIDAFLSTYQLLLIKEDC